MDSNQNQIQYVSNSNLAPEHQNARPRYVVRQGVESDHGLHPRKLSKTTLTDLSHFDDASYDRVVASSTVRMFGCFGPKMELKRSHKIILSSTLVAFTLLCMCATFALIYLSQLVGFIINKSHFDVQLSQLSDIGPDSFKLVFSSNIYRTGPIVATLSPSIMYLVDEHGETMGEFLVPEQVLDGSWGSTPVISLNTDFKIANETKFSSFMVRVMNEKVVPWRMVSNFNISLNLFPGRIFPVFLDKVVMIEGLNSFAGQKILSFDLPSESKDGVAVYVKTKVINSSPIVMSAGAAGFRMYYKDILIGKVGLPCLDLVRGENEWAISGTLLKLSPNEIETVNSFFNDFIKGRDSYVRVVGDYLYPSVADHTKIPWLQNSFSNLVMTLTMPGIRNYSPITSISVIQMFIDFASPTLAEYNNFAFPIMVDLSAKYALPFGFPVKILELSQKIRLLEDGSLSILAVTEFPMSPVLCDSDRREIHGKVVGTITVSNASFALMGSFLQSIISGERFSMLFDGEAESVMKCGIGVMSLKNLTISQRLEMAGMDSLSNPPPAIKAIRVLKANPVDGIFKEIDLELTNPSPVGSNLGQVQFDLYYNDTLIGISVVNPLILLPGVNHLKAHGLVTLPPNTPLLEDFLSQYISGNQIPIEMRGSDTSSALPLLSKPMSTLVTATTINGISIPLVEYCKISRSFTGNLFVKFRMVNPMDVPVTLTGLADFSVYFGEASDSFDPSAKINSFDVPVLTTPVVIPPRSSVILSEWIPLQQKASFALEKQIVMEIATQLYFVTSSTGYMMLLLDEFPVQLYYEQRHIKVYFGML